MTHYNTDNVFETAARIKNLYGDKAGQYAMEKYLLAVNGGDGPSSDFWWLVADYLGKLEK